MPTWNVLLTAAQIRNYEPILRISRTTGVPIDVHYHRQCYQLFTHKNSLDVLKKQSEKNKKTLRRIMEQCTSYEKEEQTKPKRCSSSSNYSNSILLPDICIFCDKNIKYKNRKPEPLRKCEVKQVREKLEKCAKEKTDYRILSLISKDNTTHNQEYKRVELEAFHLAIEYCYNRMTQSKVF